MIDVNSFISAIFYLALIVLVIALIALTIKAMHTLDKIDKAVDDYNEKSSKLNGLFNIIDSVTDAIVGVSNGLVGKIAGGLEKVFQRKKVSKDE